MLQWMEPSTVGNVSTGNAMKPVAAFSAGSTSQTEDVADGLSASAVPDCHLPETVQKIRWLLAFHHGRGECATKHLHSNGADGGHMRSIDAQCIVLVQVN
ncbi:MAG TPA: hypothetical protein VIR60_09485 [Gammaproteobacteria bacterium]